MSPTKNTRPHMAICNRVGCENEARHGFPWCSKNCAPMGLVAAIETEIDNRNLVYPGQPEGFHTNKKRDPMKNGTFVTNVECMEPILITVAGQEVKVMLIRRIGRFTRISINASKHVKISKQPIEKPNADMP